jgi:hypothetical protein
MTDGITTFCIKCDYTELHYAECRDFFIVLLNMVMLSVVMLNVIMLSVFMLNVIMLSVFMLNVIMLSVVLLNVIILNVIMLSVVSPIPKKSPAVP